MDIYIVKLVDIVLNLLTVGANLAIMGIPVWVMMLLDRDYIKERRSRRYYWLALALVVAWNVLVFALAGHHNNPVMWLTVLASFTLWGIPIMVVTALDRYRKDWRGWHYYVLAFANVAAIYTLWAALIYGSAFGRQITK